MARRNVGLDTVTRRPAPMNRAGLFRESSHFNDLEQDIDAHLYGRRMYELMVVYWPSADQNQSAPPYGRRPRAGVSLGHSRPDRRISLLLRVGSPRIGKCSSRWLGGGERTRMSPCTLW